jgi:tetratricopeptide (TPR) repeat protein
MARADRREAERRARRAQRRPSAASGGARLAEDTMFFPRLRTHARWVFVFLAVVFAGGFVFLGVGSGSSGIGDLLQGNWGSLFGSSSGASAQAKKDRARIAKNAKDYAAYKDLASALASDGKLDQAIATLVQLRALRPKDVDAAQQLAGLYLRKGDQARTVAVAAQAQAQETVVSPTGFAPPSTSKLGQAYASLSDPIVQSVQGQLSGRFNDAVGKMTAAYGKAVAAYQDVAKLSPNDPAVQFALAQTAEQASDLTTAIAAYKRFMKLAPDDPTTPAVRSHVKDLQKQLKLQASTSVNTGG